MQIVPRFFRVLARRACRKAAFYKGFLHRRKMREENSSEAE
jgi:hypothetical protein